MATGSQERFGTAVMAKQGATSQKNKDVQLRISSEAKKRLIEDFDEPGCSKRLKSKVGPSHMTGEHNILNRDIIVDELHYMLGELPKEKGFFWEAADIVDGLASVCSEFPEENWQDLLKLFEELQKHVDGACENSNNIAQETTHCGTKLFLFFREKSPKSFRLICAFLIKLFGLKNPNPVRTVMEILGNEIFEEGSIHMRESMIKGLWILPLVLDGRWNKLSGMANLEAASNQENLQCESEILKLIYEEDEKDSFPSDRYKKLYAELFRKERQHEESKKKLRKSGEDVKRLRNEVAVAKKDMERAQTVKAIAECICTFLPDTEMQLQLVKLVKEMKFPKDCEDPFEYFNTLVRAAMEKQKSA